MHSHAQLFSLLKLFTFLLVFVSINTTAIASDAIATQSNNELVNEIIIKYKKHKVISNEKFTSLVEISLKTLGKKLGHSFTQIAVVSTGAVLITVNNFHSINKLREICFKISQDPNIEFAGPLRKYI